ncbi:MAG: dihydrolipoyl dehydrogenase [Prevotella sp.]|nr:dihydrolipoyl dehydrogenase [Prevotella sp.]
MNTSDLLIIGSGPGGYRAASHAASHGMSVTIIERGHVGGTCLNCGCIPTKTLCRHAEVAQLLGKADSMGFRNLSFDLDFTQMMARKNQVVESLRQGVETLMKAPGITLVRGEACFTGPHTVMVGDEEYTAPHIIIATGSKAKMLPIPGIDNPKVVTSTELLDIDHIPARLCIVGAGVIGMEFATIFSSLGSEVTVVEYLKECLPMLDSDVSKRLRQTIARRGVTFVMQAAVKAVTTEGVVYERKGKEAIAEADVVLMATGRAPQTDGLDLEKAGIEYGRGGIVVDDHLRTNVEGVYAIGDVNGRMMLAHAATAQGLHVVNTILGTADHIDLQLIPSAIFTLPEAASVGLSEDACKEQQIGYTCHKGYYRSNGKALAMDEAEGLVKLLSGDDGRIIGCHVYGAHAADIVQEATALMAMGATIDQLHDIVHIHPTLSEILQEVG